VRSGKVTETKRFHRAFGVYGICYQEGKLLVISKNGGPYINRYDLPGGSLEDGEPLLHALKREFHEETGFDIAVEKNIGVCDFMLPWQWKTFTDVHHIAVFYLVNIIGGTLSTPKIFEGQDSDGALWISEEEATIDTASPLVLAAFAWLRKGELDLNVIKYDSWKIKREAASPLKE